MDGKGKAPRLAQASSEDAGERVAKRLARAGIASRRDVEAMIAEGRIALNGRVLLTPAVNVRETDELTVDGVPVGAPDRTRLWLFHKPRGTVTSNRDPEGRQTIFDVLPPDLPRVITVGRLDINTEGLLILTNDGGLARVLELPQTGWLRRYRVRVHGEPDAAALAALKDGIVVDGVIYGPIEAEVERVQGANAWLTIGLREGKNREVKNVLGALGLEVTRLIRVSFGPFTLGDLEEGAVREIRGRVLRDQLGEKLIAKSGADFDTPAGVATAAQAAQAEGGTVTVIPPRAKRLKPVDADRKPFKRGDAASKTRGDDAREGRDAPRKPYMPRNRGVHVWMDKGARPMGPNETEEAAARAERSAKRAEKEARAEARRAERGEPAPERGPRPFGERKSFGERKPSADGKAFGEKKPFGERKPRSAGFKSHGGPGGDGARPARSAGFKSHDGAETPRKPFDPDGKPRREGDAGGQPHRDKPFRKGPPRARAEGEGSEAARERKPFDPSRKPRAPFDPNKPRKPFDPNKPRKPFDPDRKPRAEGAEPRERKPFDLDRKPRAPFDPDKPRKPFDPDRKPGGKPGGKPFGGRPSGGKPSGGKPSGGNPSGGKPSGGKPFGGKPRGGGSGRSR
ncbi:MAG: pseudouridine synthase [Rhizobiaceae bacterium]|jgi:23S rRNA pseudouridine2605 synthase|nr:pseudouridine synthase [Rhizobiaceae bacterium]